MLDLVPYQPPANEFPFSDQQFSFLAGIANAETGIVLTANKKDMVYGRLVRRLRALGLPGFDAYCALLESPAGADELGQLVNAVTTNLTRFFREPHHFTALTEQIQALLQQGKSRIRIWSAGCSSGMEPYSIAMTLANQRIGTSDVKVLATDIDTTMLARAIHGVYGPEVYADLPEDCRKYMDAESFSVSAEARRLLTFRQLNLLHDWPMKGPFDVIFCRNVVIYFDKPTKAKLFNRMADMLTADGRLYIGHSENLHGVSDRFELVGRTVYRKVA